MSWQRDSETPPICGRFKEILCENCRNCYVQNRRGVSEASLLVAASNRKDLLTAHFRPNCRNCKTDIFFYSFSVTLNSALRLKEFLHLTIRNVSKLQKHQKHQKNFRKTVPASFVFKNEYDYRYPRLEIFFYSFYSSTSFTQR